MGCAYALETDRGLCRWYCACGWHGRWGRRRREQAYEAWRKHRTGRRIAARCTR